MPRGIYDRATARRRGTRRMVGGADRTRLSRLQEIAASLPQVQIELLIEDAESHASVAQGQQLTDGLYALIATHGLAEVIKKMAYITANSQIQASA